MTLVDADHVDARTFAQRTGGHGSTLLVLFNLDDSVASLHEWSSASADAYITKSAGLDEFLTLLKRVTAGERVSSAAVGSLVMRELKHLAEPTRDALGLTPREREIARLVACGRSNKEIAALLTLEVSTVKNHVHHVFRKAGVTRRSELILNYRSSWSGEHPAEALPESRNLTAESIRADETLLEKELSR